MLVIRLLSLGLFLPLLVGACTQARSQGVVGSGVKRSEPRALPAFHSIAARGALRLEVDAAAAQPGVTLEGDDNLIALFETHVVDGELRLGFPAGSFDSKLPLVARVAAPGLRRVATRGSIDTHVEGLAGPEFAADVSGAGRFEARGAVARAVLDVAGSIQLAAEGLQADELHLKAAGSLQAEVWATKSLSVDASGASRVRYAGSPAVEARSSGASRVEPR